jgi:hypothetical protein
MDNKLKVDQIVAGALKNRDLQRGSYRSISLNMHPWVCARCGREFSRANIFELTVHHKDHNHNNNPSNGSNWEHLCVYCHDNEHARFVDLSNRSNWGHVSPKTVTHKPFSGLDKLINADKLV